MITANVNAFSGRNSKYHGSVLRKKSHFLALPTRSFQECTLANCNCFWIQQQQQQQQLSHNQTRSQMLTCAIIEALDSKAATSDYVEVEVEVKKESCSSGWSYSKQNHCVSDSGRFQVERSYRKLSERNQMEESIAPGSVFKHLEVSNQDRRMETDHFREHQYDISSSKAKHVELGHKRKIMRSSRAPYARRIARYVGKWSFKKGNDESDVSSNSHPWDYAENAYSATSGVHLSESIEVACEICVKADVDLGQEEVYKKHGGEEEFYLCLICDLLYEQYEDVQNHVEKHLYALHLYKNHYVESGSAN
ncbi:unnamed protein product [Allacma fusca]|uniref:C2H2-type domain-containing protein n=1 Tax=Allacma fusca TaxID=39272 RepID=A0A8J2KAS5_9HEXA|nr:unnamed protein product [Allacma fusca]